MARPWYATREAVKESSDIKLSARHDAIVDRAVNSASNTVDGEMRRQFFPTVGTFTHPQPAGATGRLLFLDRPGAELAAAPEEVRIGGEVIAPAGYVLQPAGAGPPWTWIEFVDRPDGEVEIDGVAGYDLNEDRVAELAAATTDSTSEVQVDDGSDVGVGALLRIGEERMTVTGRAMADTGATLDSSLGANTAATLLELTGGTVHAGEVLLVGAERMLVVDVAGGNAVVRRAWDGTVLGAHDAAAAVFALRRLTVDRAVLGTSAAAHDQGDAVRRHRYPGVVVDYTIALSQQSIVQWAASQGQEVKGRGVETVVTLTRDRARSAVGVDLLMA